MEWSWTKGKTWSAYPLGKFGGDVYKSIGLCVPPDFLLTLGRLRNLEELGIT